MSNLRRLLMQRKNEKNPRIPLRLTARLNGDQNEQIDGEYVLPLDLWINPRDFSQFDLWFRIGETDWEKLNENDFDEANYKTFNLRDGEWIEFWNKRDFIRDDSFVINFEDDDNPENWASTITFECEDFENATFEASGNVQSLLNYSNSVPKGFFIYTFYFVCNLTTAPMLPATKLSEYCYSWMFDSCPLIIAPELPATQLAPYCYCAMFAECSYLTSAPYLPATQLVEGCYRWMFSDCQGINFMHVEFTKWLEKDDYDEDSATAYWHDNFPIEGDFVCPVELDPIIDIEVMEK